MRPINNSAYIRFLNCLDVLDRSSPSIKPDPIEEKLLNRIVVITSQGGEILVGDLICLSGIGSQATLHGRIKKLVAMGYVKLNEDKVDGRRKFVIPTLKAIKRYEQLADCLKKSLRK